VILTSAALLERQLSAPGEEKRRASVRRIADNANQIERMMRDLLDYTRTRQGRGLPIAHREADLLPLVRQIIDDMQVLYPRRTLTLAVSGDTSASIDPDRAAQVISNLVTNAITYSPADTPVRVVLEGLADSVNLAVHNQGPPIPAEIMPRLFEAFERGAADRSGLGLGLYIAQQIVEAHGGSIEVRSDAASGTTFTVRWPRAAP
jgi:signal transduction histidine kinase